MPLKRERLLGALDQLTLAKAEKGDIWPELPRTCHWFRSSGFERKGASPITQTRLTRPLSTKSLT